jgi:hypothetical protein
MTVSICSSSPYGRGAGPLLEVAEYAGGHVVGRPVVRVVRDRKRTSIPSSLRFSKAPAATPSALSPVT